MKVRAVEIYRLPRGDRRPVLVRVLTDEGLVGIGEVGIAYGIGGQAAAAMAEEMAARFLLGCDPFRIEEVWNDIYERSFWTKGGGPIVFAALSGIEQALWDIKGRALGVPVWELLGGAIRDWIEVYVNGWWRGCDTGDDFARAAEPLVAAGHRGLKLYPLGMPDPVTVIRHPSRRTLDRDALRRVRDRVEGLRRRVGPDVDIMLDFGGGLTIDQTIGICRRLEDLDVTFVEEPIDPFTPGALRKLSESTSIPIAAGERCYTRYGFHQLLETGAIAIVQPDPCNTGGILEAKKIAAMAEIHAVRVAPHNYGSTLATAVSAQLATCIPNFMALEFFPYHAQEDGYLEVLERPMEATENGRLPVPRGPGLGVTLREENVLPHLVARVGPD